jgi:hypothetical protein
MFCDEIEVMEWSVAGLLLGKPIWRATWSMLEN